MKLAAIGLCVLGLVAALSAALLISALRSSSDLGNKALNPTQVTVMVATQSLSASTLLDSSSVEAKQLHLSDVPPDYLSSPVQVVGKVLKAPMVEGQVFTANSFAEGGGPNMVGYLKPGYRAVTIQLSAAAMLTGLLYPGATVDVMCTFRANTSENDKHESETNTLLQAVEVLSIDEHTIISPEKSANDDPAQTASSRVTLMLSVEQAKKVELAMTEGVLSLALRNPTDRNPVNDVGVPLSDITRGQTAPTEKTYTEAEVQQQIADAIKAPSTVAYYKAMFAPPTTAPTVAVDPNYIVPVLRQNVETDVSLPKPKSEVAHAGDSGSPNKN